MKDPRGLASDVRPTSSTPTSTTTTMSSALAARSALNARLASTFTRRSLRPLVVHGASLFNISQDLTRPYVNPVFPHANMSCTNDISTLPPTRL